MKALLLTLAALLMAVSAGAQTASSDERELYSFRVTGATDPTAHRMKVKIEKPAGDIRAILLVSEPSHTLLALLIDEPEDEDPAVGVRASAWYRDTVGAARVMQASTSFSSKPTVTLWANGAPAASDTLMTTHVMHRVPAGYEDVVHRGHVNVNNFSFSIARVQTVATTVLTRVCCGSRGTDSCSYACTRCEDGTAFCCTSQNVPSGSCNWCGQIVASCGDNCPLCNAP